MLKLAICDDDSNFIASLKPFWKRNRTRFPLLEIATFTSSRLLLDEIQDGQYFDIFLLDIEMPNMTGLELAKEVRKSFPRAPIIFLTSHLQYSREGYHVSALRYVSKLQIEKELPEALSAAVSLVSSGDMKYVSLSYYSSVTRVPYNEIIYVHRVNRALEIVTAKHGILRSGDGIKDFLLQLDDPRFVLIERSFFVNLDFVTQISDSELYLKNGERLPISRRHLRPVRETILNLWGAKK